MSIHNVYHSDLPHYVSDCTEYESCSFNLNSCDLHVLVLYSQKYDINSVNYVVDYYLYLLYNIVFSGTKTLHAEFTKFTSTDMTSKIWADFAKD